jgi:hypothetical protein
MAEMDYRGPDGGGGSRGDAPGAGPSAGARRDRTGPGDPSGRECPAQEKADMGRLVRFVIAASTLSGLCGCAGGGLYRSIGSLPGVAWTDYAFTFYCDKATQLFQFPPPLVETSMLESLADMGFRVDDPPVHVDGECVIKGKAPDGRNVRITVAPQNAMTMVTVVIHPYLGDYQLSRDLLRRVALNFGSGMRAYTPVDLTVPRRINPPHPMPESTPPPPPEALKGEGLRPDINQKESRDSDEITVPGSVVPPILNIPGMMGGYLPTMSYPNSPYMPYAPFPYSPYNEN